MIRGSALAAILGAAGAGAYIAADPPVAHAQQNTGGLGAFDGAVLMKGLRETPGCLGVEAARTQSGKSVIFAWFENKAAAMAWYHSPVHQGAMKAVFPDFEDAGEPMAGVPDDVPIMAIASFTPGQGPDAPPIAQIAIELYSPIKGGIFIGGTFAPEGLPVKGLRDLTAP
ncbi:MAG: hypothetical protein IBJ10_05220 [Phycisphaerales bacterium]|nr:hypothetical protein [Phycisphaerales bacterium]